MNEIDMSILFDKYNEAFVVIKDRFDLLYKEFAVLGENNPIEFIKYRIKKPDSIAMKLIKKSLPFTTENIESDVNDIIGVRIVCSFLTETKSLFFSNSISSLRSYCLLSIFPWLHLLFL